MTESFFGVQSARTSSTVYVAVVAPALSNTIFSVVNQSANCQKKDWGKHKTSCFGCPAGELADPGVKVNDAMTAKVERVAKALTAVVDAWKVCFFTFTTNSRC